MLMPQTAALTRLRANPAAPEEHAIAIENIESALQPDSALQPENVTQQGISKITIVEPSGGGSATILGADLEKVTVRDLLGLYCFEQVPDQVDKEEDVFKVVSTADDAIAANEFKTSDAEGVKALRTLVEKKNDDRNEKGDLFVSWKGAVFERPLKDIVRRAMTQIAKESEEEKKTAEKNSTIFRKLLRTNSITNNKSTKSTVEDWPLTRLGEVMTASENLPTSTSAAEEMHLFFTKFPDSESLRKARASWVLNDHPRRVRPAGERAAKSRKTLELSTEVSRAVTSWRLLLAMLIVMASFIEWFTVGTRACIGNAEEVILKYDDSVSFFSTQDSAGASTNTIYKTTAYNTGSTNSTNSARRLSLLENRFDLPHGEVSHCAIPFDSLQMFEASGLKPRRRRGQISSTKSRTNYNTLCPNNPRQFYLDNFHECIKGGKGFPVCKEKYESAVEACEKKPLLKNVSSFFVPAIEQKYENGDTYFVATGKNGKSQKELASAVEEDVYFVVDGVDFMKKRSKKENVLRFCSMLFGSIFLAAYSLGLNTYIIRYLKYTHEQTIFQTVRSIFDFFSRRFGAALPHCANKVRCFSTAVSSIAEKIDLQWDKMPWSVRTLLNSLFMPHAFMFFVQVWTFYLPLYRVHEEYPQLFSNEVLTSARGSASIHWILAQISFYFKLALVTGFTFISLRSAEHLEKADEDSQTFAVLHDVLKTRLSKARAIMAPAIAQSSEFLAFEKYFDRLSADCQRHQRRAFAKLRGEVDEIFDIV